MSISARAQFTPRNAGQFVSAYISPAVRSSVQAATDLVVQTAKEKCPVDTGELQASISGDVQDTDRTVVGKITAAAPYAEYVEYGTGHRGAESAGAGPGPYDPNWPGMVAQPYMRPALDETREAVKELMRSQISLALQ